MFFLVSVLSSSYLPFSLIVRGQGSNRVQEDTPLRGNLGDRRFNHVLQQGLGRVAESLAKRLLVAEGGSHYLNEC